MKVKEKFVSTELVSKYQVDTPDGWIDIQAIGETIAFVKYTLVLSSGVKIVAADNHIVYRCKSADMFEKSVDVIEVMCKDVSLGDLLMTDKGPYMVMDISIDGEEAMFDLQLSDDSRRIYFINGILSHNSLWMQNLACGAANNGYNVLYVTLEMTEHKVFKRLGSMQLRIPIRDYDEASQNIPYMQERIDDWKLKINRKLKDKSAGNIRVKFWAASTVTVAQVDAHIKKMIDKQGYTPDVIIVDYISCLSAPKGVDNQMMFLKGKALAEGLRALGAKYNAAVITAVQVAKSALGSLELSLSDAPESKAIPETADTWFAIMRPTKEQYIYKLLKTRDGDFQYSKADVDLDTTYLNLYNDRFPS
jgi:hypothetical protein